MTTNAAGVAPLERRVRRYPLDVEGGQNEDGSYCMSKGHHDKTAFLAEARIWWGGEVDGWTEPEHKWLRVVPDPSQEWRRGLLIDAKPHALRHSGLGFVVVGSNL